MGTFEARGVVPTFPSFTPHIYKTCRDGQTGYWTSPYVGVELWECPGPPREYFDQTCPDGQTGKWTYRTWVGVALWKCFGPPKEYFDQTCPDGQTGKWIYPEVWRGVALWKCS